MTTGLADKFVFYALNHPRTIIRVVVACTLLILALAALPSFVDVPALHQASVDTDPENMLAHDEPVRVFHDLKKKQFGLSDMVVVGIVNEVHPNGVFNPQSLKNIYDLTEYARTLTWPDEDNPGEISGVKEVDIIAPSMVDNMEQAGLGAVNFSWLMERPPTTDAAALQIRERAQNIPFLNGTMVSEDGKAIAIYLPITSKDTSYRISQALQAFTSDWQGDDEIYIAGLPVTENTFGVEIFILMGIFAPLALLVIFLLLWWFFKRLVLVISPLIVAFVTTIIAMGLLIISGNTIHIMSSLIPIFVMPIAVLDAVHILSEFFDRYPVHKNKRETIKEVMHALFTPMLFTTITTVAAFASLALTPIPPIKVFGIFVAIGVFVAWVLTILFIPAYVMMIPERKLEGYGHSGSDVAVGAQGNKPHGNNESHEDHTPMGRLLALTGRLATTYTKLILAVTLVIVVISAYGISKIVINDNPTNWFVEEHPIRIADKVMNEHFGGTYMAYLSLNGAQQGGGLNKAALLETVSRLQADTAESSLLNVYSRFAEQVGAESTLAGMTAFVDEQMQLAEGEDYFAWDDLMLLLDEQRQQTELFKNPEVLQWVDALQQHLLAHYNVGKINSLTSIIKTVHRELLLGDAAQFRIPDTSNAVGQTLITYQNSHRPHDLWHFVTPDYQNANLWLQLASGDNQDMQSVMASFDEFLAENPPPAGIKTDWFGLTYINVIWQQKMVFGMLKSFLGAFVVVLVMMTLLFRSVTYGLLSVIPLIVAAGSIYGVIGLIGKNYDMPVAVLISVSVGLAIDYAIHFLARARVYVAKTGDWFAAVPHIFGEPARAISRNAIVLGVGFLPLIAADIVPYQTVGVLIAAIVFCAAITTLVVLPALVTVFRRRLFPNISD
ncbi:MAG: efflux RND transporter permease subunit [bacterium]